MSTVNATFLCHIDHDHGWGGDVSTRHFFVILTMNGGGRTPTIQLMQFLQLLWALQLQWPLTANQFITSTIAITTNIEKLKTTRLISIVSKPIKIVVVVVVFVVVIFVQKR